MFYANEKRDVIAGVVDARDEVYEMNREVREDVKATIESLKNIITYLNRLEHSTGVANMLISEVGFSRWSDNPNDRSYRRSLFKKVDRAAQEVNNMREILKDLSKLTSKRSPAGQLQEWVKDMDEVADFIEDVCKR